jgi:hypothetical protein
VLEYARHQLSGVVSADDLDEADDLRKDRALAEYGDFAAQKLSADHVRAAADLAERVVNAVATRLAEEAKPRPGRQS